MKLIAEEDQLHWSRESEQAVLGALLRGASTDDLDLRGIPLHAWRHQMILRSVEELVAKGVPIDPITVFEHNQEHGTVDDVGGLQYLTELANAGYTGRNIRAHIASLKEKELRRHLLQKAEVALEIASDPGGDPATKLDQITSLFGELQRQQVSKSPRSLAEIAVERTQHYEALERGEVVSGMPTHIPALDRLLAGGLRAGGVYIVAARPGVGKSSVSQWIGLQMARDGRRVLFLSQEMAEAEVADRAVASQGHIPYDALLSGRMRQDHWSRAVEALESPGMANFFVDDQPALTLMDVRIKAKGVKGLNALVLDYLQLCDGSSGKEANRNQEIEQISRGLKALAKELGIAVIALSQLNRQVEQRTSKRPILADLRDSGSIEQDADAVMLMWPARDLAEGAKLVGIELAKNRQGRQGATVALHFDGGTQQWAESTESLNPPAAVTLGSRRGFNDLGDER